MWKKDDVTEPRTPTLQGADPEPRTESDRKRERKVSAGQATIGPSITIHGEVSGDEDLLIQGHVEGSVELRDQSVTIGKEGNVKADIRARRVTVEGQVVGDLEAREQVILKESARVEGDIRSPRLVLEDGANFRGMVDMGDTPSELGSASPKEGKGSSRASNQMESKAGDSYSAGKGDSPAKGGEAEKPGKDPSSGPPDGQSQSGSQSGNTSGS